MKDGTVDRPAMESTGKLPGFFGAEQPLPTDEIEPEVWAQVQETVGYLPFAVQEYIAEKLGLSPIQVYGVVSFYHFFTTTPRGKHELKVCMGTACFVRHAMRLLEALKQALGVEIGEVTEDRLFSLEQVRCLGACGLAPAMMHNKETLGTMTPEDLRKLVGILRAGAAGAEPSKPSEAPSE
jgi:NADH-quinone oxidoreductase subunit E/NADP-reducing hydrogenase subunit HndA